MKLPAITALTILFLLLAGTSHAASMRCGNKVIKNNDSQSAVQNRCGKPDFTSSGYETITSKGVSARVRVIRWTYNGGRGKHAKVVVFLNGRVARVTKG